MHKCYYVIRHPTGAGYTDIPRVIQKARALAEITANEGPEKKWTFEKARVPFHETKNLDGAVLEMHSLNVTTGGK
jgi:hypothetical protein